MVNSSFRWMLLALAGALGPTASGEPSAHNPSVVQQAVLRASNPGHTDDFGFAVAVSGETIVIGAPCEDSSASGVGGDQNDEQALNAGAAYVFVRNGSSWSQQAYLKAPSSTAGGRFGFSVAIDDDTIVVGAVRDASQQFASGAAYVYVRSGGSWSHQATLLPASYQFFDRFAWNVAVSGDTIVLGAPDEDSAATGVNGDELDNSASDAGAAFVLVRSGTDWSQQAYLKASNTDASDEFGCRVAISGDTIVVGARHEDGSSTGVNGGDDDGAKDSGAAYVYTRTAGVWSQQAYLKATNTDLFDRFGSSVSVSGDTVLVGSPDEDSAATGIDGDQDDNTSLSAGAVYVFARQGTAWSQQAYLKASNTEQADVFGESVSVSGDKAIVGALLEDSAATGVNGDQQADGAPATQNSGAAYLFVRSGGHWNQQAYLKPPVPLAGSDFGFASGVSGDVGVVGAYSDFTNVPPFGSLQVGGAYVFDSSDAPVFYCTAKASSAGCSAAVFTSNPSDQPASGAGDYSITATSVQELKNGLLFAGIDGAAALPFLGGTLCVQPPTERGPVLSSGGSLASGCDGAFSTLVNDGNPIPFGLDAGPGNSAWYQYWYRDPQNGPGNLGTALSNAVQLNFE